MENCVARGYARSHLQMTRFPRNVCPRPLASACSREVTFVDSALKRGFATMPAKRGPRLCCIYALGQQLALSEFLSFPICSPFPFLSRCYIPGVKLFFYLNILLHIYMYLMIGNYEIIFNSVERFVLLSFVGRKCSSKNLIFIQC